MQIRVRSLDRETRLVMLVRILEQGTCPVMQEQNLEWAS